MNITQEIFRKSGNIIVSVVDYKLNSEKNKITTITILERLINGMWEEYSKTVYDSCENSFCFSERNEFIATPNEYYRIRSLIIVNGKRLVLKSEGIWNVNGRYDGKDEK